MSWAQPTAQYGHTPGNALASLIRSDVAAASTGLRSIAPDATAVEAAVMPYLRKSRRDRLMATLLHGDRIGGSDRTGSAARRQTSGLANSSHARRSTTIRSGRPPVGSILMMSPGLSASRPARASSSVT